LRQRERPVADLFASFNMSRPAFSQHLRILRMAGLVHQRRVGRQRVYALMPVRLRAIRRWIGDYDAVLKRPAPAGPRADSIRRREAHQ
jgi:DNA-binding transcriptional ArsR family regulator